MTSSFGRRSDRRWLYAAAFLRAFGVGMTGVLLGLYLAQRGLGDAHTGLIVGLGLAGAAAGTLLVTWRGELWGRRRSLVWLSAAAALGAAALTAAGGLAWLAAAAFVGMVNGMGRDRGPAGVLEQAILPGTAGDRERTGLFVRYHLVLDAGHALGALAAGLPAWLQARYSWTPLDAQRLALLVPAAGCGLALACYARLSAAAEIDGPRRRVPLSPRSRRLVARFAGLSLLDSLGGGFLTTSFLALWFSRRFDLDEAGLGALFAAARGANALSHLGAGWIAARIGLVRTMVFTHIPSSLLLLALPLAPSAAAATVLFLLRECLVEMDVPTRQSYLAAIVRPEERTAAAGIANLARGGAWAVAPGIAGALTQALSFSAPLLIGAALKIGYDLLLLAGFERVVPPEERL